MREEMQTDGVVVSENLDEFVVLVVPKGSFLDPDAGSFLQVVTENAGGATAEGCTMSFVETCTSPWTKVQQYMAGNKKKCYETRVISKFQHYKEPACSPSVISRKTETRNERIVAANQPCP
jgi:hypothetical protein